MRIAVTGATGFIGRHVLRAIAADGATVVGTGRQQGVPTDWPTDVEYVSLDIAAAPDAYDRLGRPETLIHLAWNGLPNYRSLHHFETELPRQFSFLKQIIEAGTRSLIVSGTCFEYGMVNGPLCETLPDRPDNPYGFAKAALRQQLALLQRDIVFNLTWARLFYCHGPGQSPNSLIPMLRRAVARGDDKFPMSPGDQLRDYLPVETVADKIRALVARPNLGPINICSGVPISVRSLVEDFILRNSWNIELQLGAYPYSNLEPHAFWGSTAKFDEIFCS